MHANGSNGTTPAEAPAGVAAPQASVETILFKAGLITADQLGEVVLERVQSGRSAGDIVVERGLVSPEALAGALAESVAPAPGVEAAPAPVVEAAATVVEAPVVEAPVVEAPVVEAPAPVDPAPVAEAVVVPEPEPVAVVEPAPVEPAPAPEQPVAEAVAAEPVVVEPVAPEPLVVEPVAPEPVAVEVAAPAPEPVQPEPTPAPAPAAQVEETSFAAGDVLYGVRIRLTDNVTLDAGSHPSREQAVEAARGIAAQLSAEGGDWPLVGDTLVRPDAVLAIEIESAVSWFASSQA